MLACVSSPGHSPAKVRCTFLLLTRAGGSTLQPGTTSTMGTAGDPGRLHKERVAPPFSLALSVPVLHPVWLVKRCISFLSCGLMYLNLEALGEACSRELATARVHASYRLVGLTEELEISHSK